MYDEGCELFPIQVFRNMFHNCVFEERLIVVVTYYRHCSPVSISLVTYYTQPNPPSQDTMMEDQQYPPPHHNQLPDQTKTFLTRKINRKNLSRFSFYRQQVINNMLEDEINGR